MHNRVWIACRELVSLLRTRFTVGLSAESEHRSVQVQQIL